MDPAETSDTASAHPAQDYEPLALIDGSCALCGWAARWIDRLDRTGRVRIMPIQSETGQAVLRQFGEDPEDPVTWLFVENGRAASGLEAVAALGRACGGVGRILQTVMILPAPLRRGLYRLVARNRYALFGRMDRCLVPDPAQRDRFIL